MSSVRICTAALALAVLGSACTFVKLNEDGNGVRAARANEVASCTKVGNATADVVYRVLFVNRSQTKVAKELETMARNLGGRIGGNRIVATSPIERGIQTFDVYRCD